MKILTFDIEDWFHLLDIPSTESSGQWQGFKPRIHANVDRILDTLSVQDQRATFFCLGWIAEKYPEVIRRIDDAGFEIASHSHTHGLVYQQTRQEFRNDLEKSIQVLEDVTGKKVKAYRAPGFSIGENQLWAFENLLELGIEVDSSIFPARRGHGGWHDFGSSSPTLLQFSGGQIREFPISLGQLLFKNIVFSGGGYFRLLPYSVIRHLTYKSDYLMSYFHPRDFDQDQPKLDLPILRKFQSYVGLSGAQKKLSRWLQENKFVDLAYADKQIDWRRVPIKKIG